MKKKLIFARHELANKLFTIENVNESLVSSSISIYLTILIWVRDVCVCLFEFIGGRNRYVSLLVIPPGPVNMTHSHATTMAKCSIQAIVSAASYRFCLLRSASNVEMISRVCRLIVSY